MSQSHDIDAMFAADLEKVGKDMPSELALNAAKVRAAQRGDKPGAEKPDLYAKGKGVGKDGKPAKDEENDERKSKGPNKGEKKDPEDLKKDKSVGAPSKDDMAKSAALDDQFAIDIHQAVGAGVPEADPEWQRPDVSVANSATDAIDEHFLSWMREKNDEGRVKTSGLKDKIKAIAKATPEAVGEAVHFGVAEEAAKNLGIKRALQGAGAATATMAAGAGAKKVVDKRRRDKTAAVEQHAENLDLLSRVRARAQAAKSTGDVDVVTEDA